MPSVDARSPVVFVSYAHDSKKHIDDVQALATLLTDSDITTELDQIEKMTTADYVVVVVSPDYKATSDAIGSPEPLLGVREQIALLRDLLNQDGATWIRKLLPVVLPGWTIDEIPRFLMPQTSTQYVIREISKEGIEDLLRAITGQLGQGRPADGYTPVAAPGAPEDSAHRSELSLIVPGFAEEMTKGRDLLDIRYDATALAVLLASTALNPPIAVGLFGRWGSGKTFLMRTIDRSIAQLADSGHPIFCRRVVGVWFNAWHYAESNLWASLLHHIFSSLHGRNSLPEQLLDEALATVESVQVGKAQAAAHVDVAHRAVQRARTDLAALETQHEAIRANATQVQARDVWNSIKVDPRLQENLQHAMGELGLPGAGQSARDLAHAAEEVRSAVRRSGQLATAGRWWKSPLALGLLAGAIVASTLVLGAIVGWVIPELAATVGQIAIVGAGAAAWLTRQAGLVRQLLEPAERIRHEIDTRLAELETAHRKERVAAEQKLADSDATLTTARIQLAEAQTREDEARAELQQLTGTQLLERYLSERVGSPDYQRYLGVVALAHRDLQGLNDHLRAASADSTGPIDRIVLYIDDLDRCPPGTVVKVLEAVHLLMALPLFAVVVGVDQWWLVRSLQDRHPLLLGPAVEQLHKDESIATAKPSDYLDKIFQITYQLPTMTPGQCAILLHHTAVSTQPAPMPGTTIIHQAVEPAPEFYEPDFGVTSPSEVSEATASDETLERISDQSAAALALDPVELRTLHQVAPLVGSSPRTAKRFLNIYRITKARVMAEREQPQPQSHPSALLLLTALVVGLPDSVTAKLREHEPDHEANVHDWLTSLAPRPTAEAQRLSSFLVEAPELAELSMNELICWLPIVRRFAWPITSNPS
jgi:RNase H-fold protein (predicted Holliday junction resolvase)